MIFPLLCMKNNKLIIIAILSMFSMFITSCIQKNKSNEGAMFTGKKGEIKLIVLAPEHFHANLLQKSSMPSVSDSVFVYSANENAGLKQYLAAIESFNNRAENPTNWKEFVYTGIDFLTKMTDEKKGNVVVLAGNNRNKTEYIISAVDAGLNILSDKPMAINSEDFLLLEQAYTNAETNNVLLYDIMTERYDMLNIIEKELINDRDFFGELQIGTPEDPSVYMENTHHFYKEVSGKPLIRPAWYYDVEQQGEGIADVTTHLIDLLFWKCFPTQSIDYLSDIEDIAAFHWPTKITLSQFTKSTDEKTFPDYLNKYVKDSVLNVYANGTLHFNVKNKNIGMKVVWNYQAPEGGGDTFVAVMKGSKAILKTEQGKDQNFVKQLYAIKPEGVNEKVFSDNLEKAIGKIRTNYPFVSILPTSEKGKFLVNIPEENREGHESHFRYVAESFFEFLVTRDMPEWEKKNTLAKYYITTKAVNIAKEKQ